jgi:hypothetical protein
MKIQKYHSHVSFDFFYFQCHFYRFTMRLKWKKTYMSSFILAMTNEYVKKN